MNKEQQERVNKESRGRVCNAKEEKGRDSFRAKFQLSRGGIYSRFWLAHRGPPQPVARLACLRFIFSCRVSMTNAGKVCVIRRGTKRESA